MTSNKLLKNIAQSLLILTLTITIVSCSSTELENLQYAKDRIINYHESGQYDKDVLKALKEAREKFKNVEITRNSVVIFDVDETALSNYPFLNKTGFGYIPKVWDEWIEEADSPPITPVRDFYIEIISSGFHAIFITSRPGSQYEATYKNLKAAGYYGFDTLITRNGFENDISSTEYKTNKREELTAMGYKIVAVVGDQWSDLTGPDHGIQIKLPNYMYLIK